MESGLMTNLTSIGTLFAFVLVAGGVLMLPEVGSIVAEQGKISVCPTSMVNSLCPSYMSVFVFLMRNQIKNAFQNVGTEGLRKFYFCYIVFWQRVNRSNIF
jgi:hypothetical protein